MAITPHLFPFLNRFVLFLVFPLLTLCVLPTPKTKCVCVWCVFVRVHAHLCVPVTVFTSDSRCLAVTSINILFLVFVALFSLRLPSGSSSRRSRKAQIAAVLNQSLRRGHAPCGDGVFPLTARWARQAGNGSHSTVSVAGVQQQAVGESIILCSL